MRLDKKYFTKMEKGTQRPNPLNKISQSLGWILLLTFMVMCYIKVIDNKILRCWTEALWISYQVGKENQRKQKALTEVDERKKHVSTAKGYWKRGKKSKAGRERERDERKGETKDYTSGERGRNDGVREMKFQKINF